MDRHAKRKGIPEAGRPDLTRRSFLKGVGGLSAALAAGTAPAFIREAGASKPRKVSFMLPWLFIGGHAFEFAAKKFYWKKRGLDVSILRGYGSGAAVKTIATGKAMFGEASYTVMVNAASKGLDAVGIGAKLQKSAMAISCRKEVGVRSAKDLEGRHIVQSPASGEAVMWPGFARAAGIDSTKVKRTFVHPSKLTTTVLNKQADCRGTYYVGGFLQFRIPTTYIMYVNYGFRNLELGLVTTRKTIKKDSRLVQDLVDGAMEGLKLQLTEPEKALDIYIEAKPELKTKPRGLLRLQMGNTNFLCISPVVEKHGLGWMDATDQEQTRQSVIQYMKAENVPPIEKLFTNRFAGNVKLSAEEWAKAKSWAAAYDPAKV
ncbi:MAG: ABC transporter substrate-binding protein [Nitrospinota bacterium]